MTYYRVARDTYSGYEVQVWRWWFPIWVQPESNTHPSIESAECWAKNYSRECVKYLGKL